MHASPNEEMAALWNGASGKAWVDEQVLLDQTFERIEAMLAGEVEASGARSVLDVGCGAGATSLAVARRLGDRGHVTGIDISEPLLAVARERARKWDSNIGFIRGDAQTHAFEPATFDLMISRFGVMFFDDPVAAFANLRRAASPGGGMRLVAFRSVAENEFMTTAERAAAPLLPKLPARRPNAPGQFAFADRDRVQQLLLDSGWTQVQLAPIDVPCAFPAADLERYITRLGPVGQALRDANEPARQRVLREVRAAFEPFVHGSQVQFIAACWMITARAAFAGAQRAASDRK
jgi:ubiquinone/menaquinone biosynthesis C-methylase UbiE